LSPFGFGLFYFLVVALFFVLNAVVWRLATIVVVPLPVDALVDGSTASTCGTNELIVVGISLVVVVLHFVVVLDFEILFHGFHGFPSPYVYQTGISRSYTFQIVLNGTCF
jgi:hypothetical protein